MKIKVGQIFEISAYNQTRKRKVKIMGIFADNHEATSVILKYIGFFGYKYEMSIDSFKKRLISQVDEAEI